MREILILGATIAAALGIGVGTPAAAPVTHNDLCGAANMVNNNALPGMMNAMYGNGAGAGNSEMFDAVARTACS